MTMDALKRQLDRLRNQVQHTGRLPWFRDWRAFPICDFTSGRIVLGVSSLFMRPAPYARMVLFGADVQKSGLDTSRIAPLGYCPAVGEDGLDFKNMRPFFRVADLGITGEQMTPTPILDLESLLKYQGYSLQTGPWHVAGTLMTLPATGDATNLVAVAQHEWHHRLWKGTWGPWLLVGLLGPILRLDLRDLTVPQTILDGVTPRTFEADLANALRLVWELLPKEVRALFRADLIEPEKKETAKTSTTETVSEVRI